MAPIAILETMRMNKLGEFVPDFTLVENPVKGVQRRITRDEAARIVAERDLRRFPVRQECEERGTQYLGAVWDTSTQTFRRRWTPNNIPTRICHHFGFSMKMENRSWLFRAMHTYRCFLQRRIERMFND